MKGRKENSFMLYLSFRRAYFSDSFLLQVSGISLELGWRRFSYLLSKDSVLLFPRSLANLASISWQWLSGTKGSFCRRASQEFWLQFSTSLHADCCPKTEDPHSNFLGRKGTIFGAKWSGQSFGFFLLPFYFVRATTMFYIPFSVQPIRVYGVQVALFDLILTALVVSRWGLFVQTQRVGEIYLTFPLSVAYHVTKLMCKLEK